MFVANKTFTPTALPRGVGFSPISGGKSANPKSGLSSTELLYANHLARNVRYSTAGRLIYQWNGVYHQTMEREAMAIHAFKWLAQNHPDKATPSKAESCVDAAILKLQKLPQRDDRRVIIPLNNGYLEALEDGRLLWLDPDPALGICYVLNVALPRLGAYYSPSMVPAGSLLEHYFNTSMPNLDSRNYLQEMAGDTLIPNVRFQRAALLKGEGRNGKSIFTRLVAATHHVVAYKNLKELSGFQLMDLVGASLAIADEVPRTGLNEQAFKALISGETVSVDMKYQKPVSVQMTAKWIICTNNDQQTSDNSFGFWRRVVIIPFDTIIADKDVIPELDRKIIASELGYFLDWCLLGLQRLLLRGDMAPLPPVLLLAKQGAMQASDPVQNWIVQQFVAISNKPVSKQKIYQDFNDWCYAQGYRMPPQSCLFWKSVKAHFGIALTETQLRNGGNRIRCANLSYS